MDWIFTERLEAHSHVPIAGTLSLTADECRRSRTKAVTDEGQAITIDLPRGTVLRRGDVLRAPAGDRHIRIEAKPEPVMTVTAAHAHDLLKGAYHLGNRHVMLEVGPDYLRLAPDPVLAHMIEHLGLAWREELAPFEPEAGAYAHAH